MLKSDRKRCPLKPGCVAQCPGCAHKYLSREQSLAQKECWLKNTLSAWATKFDPIRTVDEKLSWGYRNKVCLATRWENEHWQFGLTKNDTVIPIHNCPVHSLMIRKTVSLFSACLPPPDLFPLAYFIQAGKQVTLVVKYKRLPDLSWLDDALTRALKEIGIEGLWLHTNPCTGKKVFAKNTWHLIYGTPRSVDANQCIYGPRTFCQLIPSLHNQVLSSAQQFLAPSANDLFIDLYCGTGTGLARWRKRCCALLGVELDGEAVACAGENAPDVTILRGRCSHRVPQLVEWTNTHNAEGNRLLYANPPRTGLEPEVLKWIADTYQPDRAAYLSCSAGSLQRDLNYLNTRGYEVIRIIPFDFFPQTLHVETLVLLRHKA